MSPPTLAADEAAGSNRSTTSNRKTKSKKHVKDKAGSKKLDVVDEDGTTVEDTSSGVIITDTSSELQGNLDSIIAENVKLRQENEQLRAKLGAIRALALSSGNVPSSMQQLLGLEIG